MQTGLILEWTVAIVAAHHHFRHKRRVLHVKMHRDPPVDVPINLGRVMTILGKILVI